MSPFKSYAKRFWVVFAVLALACTSSQTFLRPGDKAKSTAQLQQQIDTILRDSLLHQSRTGIKVVSLTTGKVWYAKDSHLLFHPASNMKLLTTATALRTLGPDFRFNTALAVETEAFSDSTIHGNLYLKGNADPTLTTRDLWWLVQKLKRLGVKKIENNLVCDESYLDDLYLGNGWMWDDVSSKYWPPIGALTVNRNCVTLTVSPGAKIGAPLHVQIEPQTNYVSIENFGVTVDSSDTTQQRAYKTERKWRQPGNTIKIEGGLRKDSSSKRHIIEITQPALYSGVLLAEILSAENLEFSGEIIKGALPDSLVKLAERQSLPLAGILALTNKPSDNLYAELVLKTLGAELKGTPGTAAKGLSVIKGFLNEIGVDSTTFALADGSGNSRYNVISPDHIIALLQAMHEDFRLQAEFKASLPIAGVDGTLRNRMKGTAAEGKLRAKTGNLRGVSALSGYTTSGDGEPLAFSMIMEHFVGPNWKIKAIQDRIAALLSSFSRKN